VESKKVYKEKEKKTHNVFIILSPQLGKELVVG